MRNRQEALDWEKANAMSLWKKAIHQQPRPWEEQREMSVLYLKAFDLDLPYIINDENVESMKWGFYKVLFIMK